MKHSLYGLAAFATWALCGAIAVVWCAVILYAHGRILAWFSLIQATPEFTGTMATGATIFLGLGTAIGLISALIYSLTPPARANPPAAPSRPTPPSGGSGVKAPESRNAVRG